MGKVRKSNGGGIQKKVLGLVLFSMLMVVVAFGVVIALQSDLIREFAAAQTEHTDSLSRAIVTLVVAVVAVVAVTIAVAVVVSRRITRPIALITERVSSLGGEDLRFEVEDAYRTGDEVEELAESLAGLSVKTLEHVDEERRVAAEEGRVAAELDVASSIQASQLISQFPAFPSCREFDLYASIDPAREVGGDFYDFFLVDDDHIALVMGDVSGTGVPAALFMMVSRVLLRSHLQRGVGPAEVLENVNDQLCERNEVDFFVTVWVAVVQISTGKGVAANAGHEHPAIRRAGGSYDLVVYRHAPALGMVEGLPFREHSFVVRPGDSLFVYTDGVPEATNAAGEQFGNARLIKALNEDPDAEPKGLLENVRKSVGEFAGATEQLDDRAMLCFRFCDTEG